MRLLLDQGLPRSAAKFLREAGIDTVHVGEVGCADADDAAILQKAQGEKRTVVTLDADFHTLLALSRATLLVRGSPALWAGRNRTLAGGL